MSAPQQPATAGGLEYTVGGNTYVTNSAADYSTTTLVRLEPAGTLESGITVQGYPHGVFQVR